MNWQCFLVMRTPNTDSTWTIQPETQPNVDKITSVGNSINIADTITLQPSFKDFTRKYRNKRIICGIMRTLWYGGFCAGLLIWGCFWWKVFWSNLVSACYYNGRSRVTLRSLINVSICLFFSKQIRLLGSVLTPI